MKEALTLALELFEQFGRDSRLKYEHQAIYKTIVAIKEALAQSVQEPAAMRHSFDGYGYLYTDMGFGSGWTEWTKRSHKDAEPLYTTPPQRTWVGLAPEDMPDGNNPMFDTDEFALGAAWAQAKLKEKNT